MTSGTAGSTSFFSKRFCSETNRFNRSAWQVSDVVHPKTAADRKDLLSFSKHFRTPITPVTRTSLTGSAILFLNSSLQTKLTDDCAVGSIESGKSPMGGPEGFLRTVGISKIADLAPVKTCNRLFTTPNELVFFFFALVELLSKIILDAHFGD